jgi:CheY-like chemotaxis protein
MEEIRKRILVVDDEEFNLKLLANDLEDNGFDTVKAQDGQIALDILGKDRNFDVILLDRMMPNLNGMEVLAKIKGDEHLRDIPVIMQTAAASTLEVQEGIDAGAYYYLTKPFEANIMLAIVRSAIRDSLRTKTTIDDISAVYETYNLIETGQFKFRTLSEVSSLAYLASSFCYKPAESLIGISELMINAVEHGNLGIKFEEKTQMMIDNCWLEEVEKRLNHKSYKNKEAHLLFERKKDLIEITIEDMGEGFDWEPFLEMGMDRATLPNGRGVAIARISSFCSINYMGKGNKVVCQIMSSQSKK